MLEPGETPQPFDRLAHRMLEDYGSEIVLPFLGLEPGEATVATVDTKLTALQVRLADKLFIVTAATGARTIFHVEFFMRPAERSAAMMHVYAALIGYLQTQPEYRGTDFDAVAVYLMPGPARFSGVSHRLLRPGGRQTRHDFVVIRPWESRLPELLACCPKPFAVLGPFCAGSFEERVLQSFQIVKELSEGPQDDRWAVLGAFWALAARFMKWSAKDMRSLRDLLSKEELEQLEPYRQGRKEGLEEGREEGRQEGACRILRRLLVERFGELPGWAEPKLREIQSDEDVARFLRRLQRATCLEDVLKPGT